MTHSSPIPAPSTAEPRPELTTDAAADGGPRLMLLQRGTSCFALLASAVREVAPLGRSIRLPRAAEFVTGVVNLRGTLVPLVDPGCLLGLACDVTPRWLVALELGGRRCALAVDTLPVLRTADTPPGARPASHRCFDREASVAGTSYPLLDVEALADDVLLT